MLDFRIRKAGHKLWQDGTAIMWHRRRGPSRVRKQIGNYGLVRILASNIHPEMRSWSHLAVGIFPFLSIIGITALTYGALNGGAESSLWFTFNGNWDNPRILFHGSLGIIFSYIAICWAGALLGTSPSRSISTILAAPLMTFTLHWSYGVGVMKGWLRIRSGNPGLQIDDRKRS